MSDSKYTSVKRIPGQTILQCRVVGSVTDQGVSIPGVRASLSAYLAHLVTCCERNASQRKTSNLKGYYHIIDNSFEHHVRHRLQQ